MGCDIHEIIEVKKEIGWWQNAGSLNLGRNYELFAVLAGVRNSYNLVPISQPKGLPENCSFIFNSLVEQWNGDAHSISWVTLKELKEFDLNQEFEDNHLICGKDETGKITSTCAWSSGPTLGPVGKRKVFSLWGLDEWNHIIEFMEKTKILYGITDDTQIRLCFFFDN